MSKSTCRAGEGRPSMALLFRSCVGVNKDLGEWCLKMGTEVAIRGVWLDLNSTELNPVRPPILQIYRDE